MKSMRVWGVIIAEREYIRQQIKEKSGAALITSIYSRRGD